MYWTSATCLREADVLGEDFLACKQGLSEAGGFAEAFLTWERTVRVDAWILRANLHSWLHQNS